MSQTPTQPDGGAVCRCGHAAREHSYPHGDRRKFTICEGGCGTCDCPDFSPLSPPTEATKLLPVDRPWSQYPIGTKAHAFNGGAWTKVENGWKWGRLDGGGGVFPTPGGDACGDCIVLPAPQPTEARSEETVRPTLEAIAREAVYHPDLHRWLVAKLEPQVLSALQRVDAAVRQDRDQLRAQVVTLSRKLEEKGWEAETLNSNAQVFHDKLAEVEKERDGLRARKDLFAERALELSLERDQLRAQLTEREAELAKLAAKWREEAKYFDALPRQMGICCATQKRACANKLAELAKSGEGV